MRIEINIKTVEDDGVDWEALGTKPKKPKLVYRRRLVDTMDIEYVDEYTQEESFMKFIWNEKAVVVQGKFDDLAAKIKEAEEYYEVEDEGNLTI